MAKNDESTESVRYKVETQHGYKMIFNKNNQFNEVQKIHSLIYELEPMDANGFVKL